MMTTSFYKENFVAVCEKSNRIALIAHTNPDGDAIGSSLGLLRFLRNQYPDKMIRSFVPNYPPNSLKFIDQKRDVEIYINQIGETNAFIAAADMLIFLDFNQIHRLDSLSDAINMNMHATKVLIDHHIDPPEKFDITHHNTESSSTALLVYTLIEQVAGVEAITKEIAEPLYLGMMTDTGCFSFSHLSGQLFHAIATLIDAGVDPVAINRAVYSTQRESRVRLHSYLISENMKIIANKGAAIITLTQEEKDRFDFQTGDSEGVVNIPLGIQGIVFSAILIENKDGSIKLSLRSQDVIDVNELSNIHFNGGGHKNAAGGKLNTTMDEAVKVVEEVIQSFK